VELEEAAMLDGCSQIGAFFRVVVPLAIPGIAATSLYAWLLAWDEFLFARTLLPTLDNWTLNLGLQSYITELTISWNLAMAGGLLMTLPSLLVYLLLQRYLIAGLTGGAVKG
jgi:multiple sugar transport system permease protein